ncbi:MAG: Phosphoglucosamine mutase [candidate division TM6 bacterium GW2011_GWF2_38_10]|nr:MAG: Phosphoglucosamine mutase [candidate division TM6 bacterium GW2011_GWF2_38_10]
MITKLAFGTDGIRAHENDFPFEEKTLFALGRAIGIWAQKKYTTSTPEILITSDTRASCPKITAWLATGLMHEQVIVHDGGILPTPGNLLLIKHTPKFNAGIVISASHNPYHDNGIKFFDACSGKISDEDQATIIHLFSTFYDHTAALPPVQTPTRWAQAQQTYVDFIVQRYPTNTLAGTTIALDCAHGATYEVAPAIFKTLGATLHVINNHPTGYNINQNCGSLFPQTIQKTVETTASTLGFAFDGDGDRLVAVGNDGSLKNGDDVLYLLSQLPQYAHVPALVGTIMSNKGLEFALQQGNKKLIQTAVGDRHVVQAMHTHHLPLGGESSGHTIINDYLPTSDGIVVALELARYALMTQNINLESFVHFPSALINLKVQHKIPLSTPALASLIKAYERKIHPGALLIRYSGTEPILRIMTQAQTQERATEIAQSITQELQALFS